MHDQLAVLAAEHIDVLHPRSRLMLDSIDGEVEDDSPLWCIATHNFFSLGEVTHTGKHFISFYSAKVQYSRKFSILTATFYLNRCVY